MDILDDYVKSAPSIQNALDIFKGQWVSQLPGDLATLNAGQVPLFEDSRITWIVDQIGGVEGQKILELGPLEAGHTYMLEKRGAASITSIEANTRAYVKCLIIKEVLGLNRSHFICGDCVRYLQTNSNKFDVCLASGILYHMEKPAELIALMAKSADKIFLWTHYYDADLLMNDPRHSFKFTGEIPSNYQGFQHTLYRQEYGTALDCASFCGGSNRFSCWMSRSDILACLKYFGFSDIQINFEVPDHPNGPSFALFATKKN